MEIPGALLSWYDRHHRDLPWRIPPHALGAGARPDPYRVWLSEIMLQQTTVGAVRSYYLEFLRRWPTITELAEADTDEVMRVWAGLGYYSRARNLKKCAEMVVREHRGQFPGTEAELRKLPGIGDYTAAAIAAIAFGRPAAVVDGNVERVVSRLRAIDRPLPDAKPAVRTAVQEWVPPDRPGDFAQAMMDLGATICTPRRPACALCPINGHCAAFATNDPERFPLKVEKPHKPMRRGAVFVAIRPDGAILLRKRADKGLLGGMTEVPTSAWTARQDGATDLSAAPFVADWNSTGTIDHVFTHFSLRLDIYRAETDNPAPPGYWWSAGADIHSEALPTVMKKAIEAAIPGVTKRSRNQPGRKT